MNNNSHNMTKSFKNIRNNMDYSVAGDERPLIPPCDLMAQVIKTYFIKSFGGRKDFVAIFKIYEGENAGMELKMYCPYYSKLLPSHKLYKMWAIALGRRPQKGERFSQKVFKGKMYLVEVCTVTTDTDHDVLPPFLHYSKVKKIKECCTYKQGEC